MLNPDGCPVEPDRVPTDRRQRHELVDGAIGIDDEVGADTGCLVQLLIRCVRDKCPVSRRERRRRCVVLNDHLRVDEAPCVKPVVALRVSGGLCAARRPEWDRLPHNAWLGDGRVFLFCRSDTSGGDEQQGHNHRNRHAGQYRSATAS